MKYAKNQRALSKVVRDDIERTLLPNLRKRAKGQGQCSVKTASDRREHILSAIGKLWKLGYRIQKLKSLRPEHIEALMACWDQEGVTAAFLHNRLSVLRTLSGWLNKPYLVKDLKDYLPPERTRRKTATDVDRSWEGKGIDPQRMINYARTLDERLAVILAMQFRFGLRVKESIELRPANSVVEGGAAIEVYDGTKGGRPRRIPVETDEQREALAWARRVAVSGNTKRLRWPGLTWLQARRRFYHYMHRHLMISKEQLGVTAHGLRHGYAHVSYEDKTGVPAPVKIATGQGKGCGGNGAPTPPPELTRASHLAASQEVSRALGHGRIDVTPSYYGTYGHALRPISADRIKVTVNGQAA